MADKFRDVKDEPAPGSVAGKIVTYTPEEAAKLKGERDADEAAFNNMLDGDEEFEEDLDDVSDLEDGDGEFEE